MAQFVQQPSGAASTTVLRRRMIPKERIVTGMTGKPAETASDRTATQPKGAGLASRPVLTVAEATRAPGSKVEVCVALRVGRQRFEGLAVGVGLETIELRLAAEATLHAIHQAIGDGRFALVGIKRMRAFDADVILVSLRDQADQRHRFIGAVPVRSTLVHGAAAAVLDATNRILTAPAS